MRLDVDEPYFDDENLGEMARHHVTPDEANQVRDGHPSFHVNIGTQRAASHVMVGRTFGGRLLFVPISRVMPGVWRPRTAFEPTPHQANQRRRPR
jgi:hypothetical protein